MIVLDDATLLGYLREDAPYGDLTTRSLGLGGRQARMHFSARDAMTVCAVEEAGRIMSLLDCTVHPGCRSGAALSPGAPILTVDGSAERLLLGWKVAQTMVEWASGVATLASRMVAAARAVSAEAVVACTRKAVPGTRALSAKAVLAGGASLHRTGLSDTVLLFPEHRVLGGDGEGLLETQIARLKLACPERAVVVEVTRISEALEAFRSGADVLQLEKFPVEGVAQLIARLPEGRLPRIAAAGGITLTNIADYVRAGADVLVTSAPYTARPADVQVTLEPRFIF